MANIEIDGKKLEAREGAMVIEAADDAGIYIPRFCYHKKLSIAANCRMCLIEIEKVGKALPACATPVTDGMKVFTRSPKAIGAQKGVMEFLLINHPLDCPICDQGGECELQDIAMGYGSDVSAFSEGKRVVPTKDFGPLICGDMTRCIHCTRCVRFGEEIAGIKELGATGRGEHMEIGTFIKLSLSSEMSGNIIDLCPVGALTSKPFRFTARAWEIKQHATIAPHDCLGSNVLAHTFRNEVVRMVPRENDEINETWLSDRDRFSYEGLNSPERVTQPMVKTNGKWDVVSWDVALHKVVDGLSQVIKTSGAEQIGGIASPTMTLEELYLLQKLLRSIGSGNIDHRLSQQDFSDDAVVPVAPILGQSIQALEKNDAVLLVGSNIRHDQPIAGHRIRKAALQNGKIMCVNTLDYDFNFPVAEKIIASPATLPVELGAIVKALAEKTASPLPEGLEPLLANVTVEDVHNNIAAHLIAAKQAIILLGRDAFSHSKASALRALATQAAKLAGCDVGYLPDGANGAGAWLAGAVPHRGAGGSEWAERGKDLATMLRADLDAFVLMGVEPELDCTESQLALKAMQQAGFVVSLSAFVSDTVKDYADVILPIATFTETSGTFVSAEGRWQNFEGVVPPRGDARPAWKILRVLGNLFDCAGFEFVDSQQVSHEVRTILADTSLNNKMQWRCPESLNVGSVTYESIPDRRMYAGDSLVRRAVSLQAVEKSHDAVIRVNQSVAKKIGLENGQQAKATNNDTEILLPVMIDSRVPDGSVLMPAQLPGAVMQGVESGAVTLTRA